MTVPRPTPRRLVLMLVAFVVAALASWWLVCLAAPSVMLSPPPSVAVMRGDLELRVGLSGELRSARVVPLRAPPAYGDLRIVSKAPTGSWVSAGEPVIELDPSGQEFELEQGRSELAEALEEARRAELTAKIELAGEEEALLKARNDVRRAELDVRRSEILSAMDARRNAMALEEARRRLAQKERDAPAQRATSRANAAIPAARIEMLRARVARAEQALAQMRLLAPQSGYVAILENRGGETLFSTGLVFPEYRVGDVVSGNAPLAEIVELGNLQVQARVEEAESSRMLVGQTVTVRLDARPREVIPGKVARVASVATREPGGAASGRRAFDVSIELGPTDSALRPGLTARVEVDCGVERNVLLLPRQVVFDAAGVPVVYRLEGSRLERTQVRLVGRGESLVAIEGLPEGARVALVNPEAEQASATADAEPLAPVSSLPREEVRGKR